MERTKPKSIPSKSSPRRGDKPSESRARNIPGKSSESHGKPIPTKPRPQSQMAMSCPQPRFLQTWPWNQHYGRDTWPWSRDSANSSPQKRQVRASSDTAATNRMTCSMYEVEKPNSSKVPYEGGFFGSSLHNAKRDFFVIHPDWVSEDVTVKKITATDRRPRQMYSAPSRRCRSAPPPKYRNPITWQ